MTEVLEAESPAAVPRTGRRVLAGLAVLVLGVRGVLPVLLRDHSYGEVPIPGSAIVHLPAGEVDATLRTAGPADGQSTPALSIRISGPDGAPRPEVVESRRTRAVFGVPERVWVLRIPQEADYHIAIDGEVYGSYQPSMTFGHVIWNAALPVLGVADVVIILILLCGFVIPLAAAFLAIGLTVLLQRLWKRWVRAYRMLTGSENGLIGQGSTAQGGPHGQ